MDSSYLTDNRKVILVTGPPSQSIKNEFTNNLDPLEELPIPSLYKPYLNNKLSFKSISPQAIVINTNQVIPQDLYDGIVFVETTPEGRSVARVGRNLSSLSEDIPLDLSSKESCKRVLTPILEMEKKQAFSRLQF